MIISSSNKTINTYPLLNLLREGENIDIPEWYTDGSEEIYGAE